MEVVWILQELWGCPRLERKGVYHLRADAEIGMNSDKTQLGGLSLTLDGAEQIELVGLWSWKLKDIVTSSSALSK